MAKKYNVQYKASFSIFQKKSLKPMEYSGKIIHPLYIQVTHKRNNTHFPSYYFGIFSQPSSSTVGKLPSIEQIIQKEKAVLNHIIEKLGEDFSFEYLKTEYGSIGRDLLNEMEKDFIRYLTVFFHDEGLPTISYLLESTELPTLAAGILDDLETALHPALHSKMLENAIHYAPPYVPIYHFAHAESTLAYPILPIFEWLQPETQERFDSFLKEHHPQYDAETIRQVVQKYIT